MAAINLDPEVELLKIALAVVIILSFGFFEVRPAPNCADCLIYKGLPIPFEISGGFAGKTEFIGAFFFIDILFWYFVSWVLVWLLSASWKKNMKKN